MYCCYFGAVYAEENNTETDSESETVNNTSEKASQAVTQAVEVTPQPPLIDAQPQPSYEPKTTDNIAEQESNHEIEQAVEDTPQPPLIDAQAEPVYEPAAVENAPEKTETITPTEQPSAPDQQTITDSTNENNDIDDVVAESEEQPHDQNAEKTNRQTTKWTDTHPGRVSADWLQLTSGEWLRGRIIAMQKDELEFDSDELKKLTIEWKKVKYIKSSDPYRLRFDDNIDAIGAIEITQQEIHVTTDYDDQVFDRSNLLTIASGKETEISYWTSKITFSINVRRGNTDQTDFTSRMNAKRQTINSRLTLEYFGNFTEVENTETINNHRVNGTYDIFITRYLFLTPIAAEYYRDPFQNIDQRIYIGTGVGYSLIKTNKTEWDVSGGPAYQTTKFVSVQPGQSAEDDTLALILSTNFDTELNSKVDLKATYSATLGDNATGNYTHHSIFTVETEITDKLDFDVSLVWDRVRSPVPDENNVTPEQDDFRFLVGLGYDL